MLACERRAIRASIAVRKNLNRAVREGDARPTSARRRPYDAAEWVSRQKGRFGRLGVSRRGSRVELGPRNLGSDILGLSTITGSPSGWTRGGLLSIPRD